MNRKPKEQMKKPEITPGKWAKDKKAKSRIHAANDRQVAACGGHTSNVNAEQVEAENDANATAIAALPDLLEALERAVSIIEDLPHPENIPAQDLRQALVKAGYTVE